MASLANQSRVDMNIVSALVGLSIMGVATPAMVEMSLAPFQAQKRAQNFATAESRAVSYAGHNEGLALADQSMLPIGCVRNDSDAPVAFTIRCTEGTGAYVQSVSRSYREGNPPGARTFPITLSKPFGSHQCNVPDEWGVNWASDWPTLNQCLPQVAWSRASYLASNPDDWLYDVNNIRGFGQHPNY